MKPKPPLNVASSSKPKLLSKPKDEDVLEKSNDESENLGGRTLIEQQNLSVLMKSFDTSVTTLRKILTVLGSCEPGLFQYLDAECGVIFECRVCKNFFRSVANFTIHKVTFCSRSIYELNKTHEHPDQVFYSKCKQKNMLSSRTTTRDDVIDILKVFKSITSKTQTLDSNFLQKIPDIAKELLNVQHESQDPSKEKSAANESSEILNENEPIIESEEPPVTKEGPTDKITCHLCQKTFSNQKAFDVHMKQAHKSMKQCFACPCCNKWFANSWSVYRHLYKVHRKSSEQVRKLRLHIIKKEVSQEEFDKGKKQSSQPAQNHTKQEDKATSQDPQAHSSLQCCADCGKRFDRKVSLLSHAAQCQKKLIPSAELIRALKRKALNPARPDDDGKKPKLNLSPETVAEMKYYSPRVVLTKANWPLKDNKEDEKEESNTEVLGGESSSPKSDVDVSSFVERYNKTDVVFGKVDLEDLLDKLHSEISMEDYSYESDNELYKEDSDYSKPQSLADNEISLSLSENVNKTLKPSNEGTIHEELENNIMNSEEQLSGKSAENEISSDGISNNGSDATHVVPMTVNNEYEANVVEETNRKISGNSQTSSEASSNSDIFLRQKNIPYVRNEAPDDAEGSIISLSSKEDNNEDINFSQESKVYSVEDSNTSQASNVDDAEAGNSSVITDNCENYKTASTKKSQLEDEKVFHECNSELANSSHFIDSNFKDLIQEHSSTADKLDTYSDDELSEFEEVDAKNIETQEVSPDDSVMMFEDMRNQTDGLNDVEFYLGNVSNEASSADDSVIVISDSEDETSPKNSADGIVYANYSQSMDSVHSQHNENSDSRCLSDGIVGVNDSQSMDSVHSQHNENNGSRCVSDGIVGVNDSQSMDSIHSQHNENSTSRFLSDGIVGVNNSLSMDSGQSQHNDSTDSRCLSDGIIDVNDSQSMDSVQSQHNENTSSRCLNDGIVTVNDSQSMDSIHSQHNDNNDSRSLSDSNNPEATNSIYTEQTEDNLPQICSNDGIVSSNNFRSIVTKLAQHDENSVSSICSIDEIVEPRNLESIDSINTGLNGNNALSSQSMDGILESNSICQGQKEIIPLQKSLVNKITGSNNSSNSSDSEEKEFLGFSESDIEQIQPKHCAIRIMLINRTNENFDHSYYTSKKNRNGIPENAKEDSSNHLPVAHEIEVSNAVDSPVGVVPTISHAVSQGSSQNQCYNPDDDDEKGDWLSKKISLYMLAPKKKCLLCYKTFLKINYVRRHVAAHFNVHKFKCLVNSCNFQSFLRTDINSHLVKVHKKKDLDSYVGRLQPKKEDFSEKYYIHEPKSMYPLEKCWKPGDLNYTNGFKLYETDETTDSVSSLIEDEPHIETDRLEVAYQEGKGSLKTFNEEEYVSVRFEEASQEETNKARTGVVFRNKELGESSKSQDSQLLAS